MISREPVQEVANVNAKPSPTRESRYAPPKLEKMQQLARVTGLPATTGTDE